MRGFVCVLALAGCGGDGGRSPDARVSTEPGALGMNDVSILLPLPATSATAVIANMTDGGDLVPRDQFTKIVVTPNDIINTYEEFHLVAIRFDLCDRPAPGVCPPGDDGRLRLVFQPLFDSLGTQAGDVALHAFYPIPNAELPIVVDELRRLAAIANTPTTEPLRVSTAVANVTYANALRTLVMTYADDAKLTRLTVFAQNAMTASLNWAFRGVEMKNGALVDIVIPDIAQTQQRTILTGNDTTYSTMPIADSPAGFATAIDSAVFAAASPSARMQALEAMAAIQNPMTHSAETVQCIGCHVTTFLTARRAAVAGVDPSTIAGRYAAPYDLATTGSSTTNDRSLRAFGYLFEQAQISQRVVNDTAQVLVEIDARYPPARP